MSGSLSSAEIEEQHLEMLPARTVMSIFTTDASSSGSGGDTGSNNDGSSGDTTNPDGGLTNGLDLSNVAKGLLLSDQALKCDITPVDWSR